MTREWITVTEQERCPICEKPDWCSRSASGKWIICRRKNRGDGRPKTDKSGATFWIHRVDNGAPASAAQPVGSEPAAAHVRRADDADLDRVYAALLNRLDLSTEHRENLRARGLTDEQIDRGRYRSLPRRQRSALARCVLELFDHGLLERVPGFGWQKGTHNQYFTVFGAVGLLVPVRNAAGQIVALKVRADEPGGGSKYSSVSSAKYGGPSPGAPDHHPLEQRDFTSQLRITEGEIKADIATAKSDIYTIGVAGIARCPAILAEIPATREVVLAPDADALENPHVARCVIETLRRARELGIGIAVESWDASDGKGIDDVLASGGAIRVLRGADLSEYEKRLLRLLVAEARQQGSPSPQAPPTSDAEARSHDRSTPEGSASSATEEESVEGRPEFSEETGIANKVVDGALRAAVAQARKLNAPRFIYSTPLFDQIASQTAAEAQCALLYITKSVPKMVQMATLRKLLSAAEKRLRLKRREEEHAEAAEAQSEKLNDYFETATGLAQRVQSKDGPSVVALCNFVVKIVSEVVKDDGLDTRIDFELEGFVCGEGVSQRFSVPAEDFADMEWVLAHLGARAIVRVDARMDQHVRAAIQTISRPQRRIVYTHLGWQQIGSRWFYLHAGGAIGTVGTVGTDTEIHTCLEPTLQSFRLPESPSSESLRLLVRTALELLAVAPDRISFPLLASVFRAGIGDCDFTVFLAGDSGTFKSAVAALLQSFWGSTFTGSNLPCSWLSTANANEGIAFSAKDCLLVVDDFAPRGGVQDVQRYHREADRLLRGQGNRSGRARMRPDGTMRATRFSRCLFLSTGEDLPTGQSLRARLYAIQVRKGDVDVEALTRSQAAAGEGVYASVLAGFLEWMAPRCGEVKERLARRSREIRDTIDGPELHRRTPTTVSELSAAFEIFAEFAQEVQAVDPQEAAELQSRCTTALLAGAEEQVGHVEVAEPVSAFFTLLNAAISSGQAHVASLTGGVPVKEGPGALGWRKPDAMPGASDSWNPQGARVGWIDGDDLYLEFPSAFRAAQTMSCETTRLSISPDTLKGRVDERGMLLSREEARQRFTVRKSIEGSRREVLHIGAVHLGLPSQPSQPPQFDPWAPKIEPLVPRRSDAPRFGLEDPETSPDSSRAGAAASGRRDHGQVPAFNTDMLDGHGQGMDPRRWEH